jgi:hypothetical protein
MGIWYATREDVKSALDSQETARNDAQVDRLIEGASRSVDTLCHRVFFPWTGTRSFDWPNDQHAGGWRLWLNQDELVSVSAVVSDGDAISTGDVFLEPSRSGPPYTHLDLDRSTNAAFTAGGTAQRSLAITGVYAGCPLDETDAGALAEALDSSETAVDVTNSAVVGVGSLIRVDDERMVVTGKSLITSGHTLQTDLTASAAGTTVAVTTGSAFHIGETVTLDAEQMLIVDIAGNNLLVKRAWNGSVLATHSGSTIYVPRTLLVTRGVLGTTAAAHDTAAAVSKFLVPGLVRQLTIAEALTALQQEGAAYGRVIGSGDAQREASGKGLADLRCQVYDRHGRKVRARAI